MSKLLSRGTLNPFAGLFAFSFIALLLADVQPMVAAVGLLAISAQTLLGGLIFSSLVDKSRLTWQEFCGVGLALGSLITVAFDQVFRKTSFANFAWLIPLVIVAFLPRSRELLRNIGALNKQSHVADLVVIGAMGLLIVATDWFWALPLVVLLVASIAWIEFVEYRKFARIFFFVSIPISFISVLTRPNGWWIEDSDFALNEALIQTLKVWGFTDNINGAGTSTQYHWLAYGWSALIERVSDSPNWVINSRLTPLVISIGSALLIWAILNRLGLSRRVILFSLLIIGLYDTVPTWGRGFVIGFTPSPSQMYGLLFLLSFVFLTIATESSETKRTSWLFFALGFGAMSAKVPHGAILIAASGLLILVSIFKSKKLFSATTFKFSSAIVGALLSFALVIGGLSGSSRGMILDQVAFVNGITGDFRPYPIHIRWLAALVFIFGFYGVHILGLLRVSAIKFPESQLIRVLVYGIGISGLLATMFLSGEFAVELFFSHASSSVLVIFIAPLLVKQYLASQIPKNLVALVIVVALLSAVLSAFIPNIESGSNLAIALRLVPSLVGLLPIFAAIAGVLFISKARLRIAPTLNLVLCGLVALCVGFFGVNFARNVNSEYPEFERNFANRTGQDRPDLISASNWISSNTSKAAIFATNDFCETLDSECNIDTNWVALMERSMNCTQNEVLRTENCDAGGYKLLTALVDRRFLAGNYYVGISDGSAIKPWVAKRVIDSVNFAKFANAEATQTLKDQNVEWFLLRKELTNSQDWQKYGTVEYSNDSYAVIKLN